jgi:CheY-like chemotaxis protein
MDCCPSCCAATGWRGPGKSRSTGVASLIDGSVLIVDDDPLFVAAISASLELRGVRAQTASNGAEALAVVERERPALIFLDVHMPILDAPGFVQALSERGITLPIVLMSSDEQLEAWARELGAIAYLPKPFELVHLNQVVDQVLDPSPQGAEQSVG